ncbi:MAG: hypothetical protein HKM89_13995 [Gemmatimonadales bacterium]|nr:hypothetical protein [Gemmatimonadales bacterium]
MHVLSNHFPRTGQLVEGIGTHPARSLARFTARIRRGILRTCRPVARSLGMSDKPWSAVSWILIAVMLALLFVITFVMFEGSMWT